MHHRAHLAAIALAIATTLPLAAAAQSANTGQMASVLKGEVLEVQNVESYTYMRLKTQQGEIWAAVTTAAVKKGDQVNIANPTTMENFESKSLKRRFDKIVFGTVAQVGGKDAMPNKLGAPAKTATMLPTAPTAPTMAAAHAGTAAPAAAAAKVEKVAKATGADARTVAEVVGGKAGLKNKTVVVRARVVKVNNDIMGKNWLHVQDGSGAVQDGNHDMLVTTKDKAAVGDVVTLRGTVRTDVTLGAGYAYAVIVEDATVRK